MRVSLPVDPHVKVESEAATIKLVEQHTDIPVPSIIGFDSFNENDLGYEWILMKSMKGQILETAWKTMAWQEKGELVRKVAHYLAQ
jgi:aminoglycoside phosphotransferase (APT) family kinase protein